MRLTYYATDGNILSPPLVHEGTLEEARHIALQFTKEFFGETLFGFPATAVIDAPLIRHTEEVTCEK